MRGDINLPFRQINDFLQKGNRKKVSGLTWDHPQEHQNWLEIPSRWWLASHCCTHYNLQRPQWIVSCRSLQGSVESKISPLCSRRTDIFLYAILWFYHCPSWKKRKQNGLLEALSRILCLSLCQFLLLNDVMFQHMVVCKKNDDSVCILYREVANNQILGGQDR